MSETAWLTCPECGDEAVVSTGFGCLRCEGTCEDAGHDHEPIWTDGDHGDCSSCGAAVRVIADGERAYLRSDATVDP